MGDLIEMMWWNGVIDVILAFLFCAGMYIWIRLENTRN